MISDLTNLPQASVSFGAVIGRTPQHRPLFRDFCFFRICFFEESAVPAHPANVLSFEIFFRITQSQLSIFPIWMCVTMSMRHSEFIFLVIIRSSPKTI